MSFSRFESLERLGFSVFFQRQLESLLASNLASPSSGVARVLAEVRGRYVVSGEHEPRRAVLAGRLEHRGVRVCVGDFVLLEANDTGSLSRIEHVFERTSLFQRKAPESFEAQLIAANVDLAIVVCALASEDADPHALSHGLNARRIERYLHAVREAPARPLVVVNKADLSARAEEHSAVLRNELRNTRVIAVSAESGGGMADLEQELLPGTTAVLVGSSGVGKSSLTNRLLGRVVQDTGDVRSSDTRGRHTTTGRELFVTLFGALLIDTPGMREFGLFADDARALADTGFPEIDELAPACRFRDCRHLGEPGCAVLAAVESGSVASERLDQAHKFERELAWQRDRHDPLRAKEQRAVWRARTRAARADQKQRRER